MKQPRTRIAPNIYRYPDGRYEVLVSAAGRQAPPTRFPAKTPIEQMEKWIAEARKKLTKEARDIHRADFGRDASTARTGTLRTEAPDYFAQISGRPSTAADVSHLRAWFEVIVDRVVLGDLPLAAWTTAHVNKAIALWQTAPSPHAIRHVRIVGYGRKGQTIERHERRAPATSGRIVSALTIRHRCRVLEDFFHTTFGKKAETPVDDAKVPPRHSNPPATVPVELVQTVLERLSTSDRKMFARFYLATTTGQRPCQIGRARPEDVQPTAWLVRNAKGEPAHSIVLNPAQRAAWKAFIAADAWGSFDTSAYGKAIHAAGWPNGVRPYTARHSLAREALRRGASLGDVQALLGHLDPNTTRRTYAPFQVEEQQSISDRLAPYLADVLKPRLTKKGGK